VRFAAATALFLCGLAAAAPAHADDAELAAPIDQCIRGNAVKVSAAILDLNAAVDFLVEKVCAKPVADDAIAAQRTLMDQYHDRLRKTCETWKAAHPNGDAATPGNEEAYNPCQMADATNDEGGGINWALYVTRTGSASPAAVALAAKLLLDLRLAHPNPPGR
jgi:hypothetical protein